MRATPVTTAVAIAFLALGAASAGADPPGRGRGRGVVVGHAVPRAPYASRPYVGPYGSPYLTRIGRPYFVRPYGYGFRRFAPFYRPYYAFRPRFSLGFGLSIGYPVAYPYWGYGYPYPAPYYSPYYSPYYYPSYGYYPRGAYGGGVYASDPNAYGGVSLEISPPDAQVYADGAYLGRAGDFTPTSQPLSLAAGRHQIELRAPGYRTMAVEVDVTPGQVIPYRGTMQPLPY